MLSSSLNFLDRNLLAALAPEVEKEFHIDDRGYGFLVSAFSLAYALSSPVTGYVLDRLGLNRAAAVFVGFWSAIGILTGLSRSYLQLILCRVGLGVGESGGIPAVAKMGADYLPAEERALGSAVGQVGITIGAVLAPAIGPRLAAAYGWRFPFLITGVLGLLWIPLWLFTARKVGATGERRISAPGEPLDRRLLLLVLANVMWMGAYSLWTNWTTLYLVRVHHLTLGQTARYAWLPPAASTLGGFFGGWLAMRLMRSGVTPVTARVRVIFVSALGGLSTLLVPFAPGPVWGAAAIAFSFFWTLAGSVNVYTLPIDLYGPERAGRAISALVFAYGLLQAVISVEIGRIVTTAGYGPVCVMVALPQLLAWAVLRRGLRKESPAG